MKSLLIIDILGSTRYYLALKLKIRNYFFLFEKNIYLPTLVFMLFTRII